MKWFLVVYFIINGETFPGERFNGWSPREHVDEQSCKRQKIHAERISRPRGVDKIIWECELR